LSTPNGFRTLAESFEQIADRCGGKLRADHQAGGWGRSERELLARGPGGGSLTAKQFERIRPELEAAAAIPHWFLRGADEDTEREFMVFANRGAKLVGFAGADGWLAWLDQMLAVGFGRNHDDARPSINASIADACAASIGYCNLLATGAAPSVSPPEKQPCDRVASAKPLSLERRKDLAARIQTLTPEERKELAIDRRRRIEAYLLSSQQDQPTGRPTRAYIWQKLKYKTPKDFEQWQRADRRTTIAITDNVERFLCARDV
jgi:hypothetical protein